jgi:hypothetical protein
MTLHSYAPKKLTRGNQRQTFFDSCLLDLKSWRYRLPPELQTRYPGTSDIQTRPHVYILDMVYHTSIIMLAKPFLTQKQRSSTDNPAPESQSKSESHIDQIAERAATLCMDAAREICLLGEQYRKTFGSFRQSPVTPTHCTLSAVLFLILGLKHCRGDDDDGENHSKATTRLVNSCAMTLAELANAWMPARQYWKAVVSMVKGREPSQSRVQGSSSSPVVESTPPRDPAVAPVFNTGAIDGSVWDNALNGADLMAGLEDMGTWYAQESYEVPLLDGEYGEYLFNSSVFQLPAGFDLFSSGNPDPDFAL